ncbi:hypothetical protein [Hyphococcus sp.]|jgi:hypothetical protein|uniref:hypothetical protein n=1 Tax=Hyphococcus sp. TaxID=2038636 RepID=UPI003D0C524B
MIAILTKALPVSWRPLSARLSGVNGFTGRGAVAFQLGGGGAKKLSIEIHGVAGREAEVVVNDEPAATLKIAKGRASATFASKRGDKLPDASEGSRIDIRQNGEAILSGVLSRN